MVITGKALTVAVADFLKTLSQLYQSPIKRGIQIRIHKMLIIIQEVKMFQREWSLLENTCLLEIKPQTYGERLR